MPGDAHRIRLLVDTGHSIPCAKRQAWGDGECVCLWRPRYFIGVDHGTAASTGYQVVVSRKGIAEILRGDG